MKKLVKTLLILTLLIVFLMPQFAVFAKDSNNENDEYDNYSEAYKNYLKLSDEEKESFGVIPRKYDIPLDTIYENTTEVKEESKLTNLFGLFAKTYRVANNAESLPEKFNLCDKINIPVKNQNSYGDCWAFAGMRSLETYLSMHDFGEYDFSELHADYLTSSEFGGGRTLHVSGAFFNTLENYFFSMQGPVLEAECPYNKNYTKDEYDYLINLKPKACVKETINFPTIDKFNNKYSDEELKLFRDSVKKHIIENGSVWGFFGIYGTGFLGKNYYCTDRNINSSHAMSIIGWDDSYSKDNFQDFNGNKPEHDGAYIVLNSYGSNEILYVSYDDCWVEYDMNGIKEATTEIINIEFQDENLYNAIKNELYSNKLQFNDNEKSISGFEKSINDIGKVEKLDLSNRNITDLSGIENFTGLTELNLSHNNISNIDKIIELTKKQVDGTLSLSKLDLSYNNIENISEKLNKYFSKLDLSYNNIEDATNFCNLTSSDTIDLSGNPLKNGIQELYSCWGGGVILDNCGLESNDFDIINDYFGVISLRDNNIENASFLQNISEGAIDLSGNANLDLSSLPLNSQRWLTLENCNISNLGDLKTFNGNTLDLSDNPISDISIFGNSENFVNIQKIDLGNTNVSDISVLNGIERIDLSGNKNLTGLNNLNDVKELTIKNCDFTSLPDIGNNVIIETFDISNNKLEDISKTSNYTTLKSLNLSNNNISNISALQELTNLEFLDLSNNKVVDISALVNKNNLYRLNLSNNLIEDVSIFKNSNLYTRGEVGYINLSGNKINDLEDVLQFWSNYESFIQNNEEAKENQKLNNQHYDMDAEFVVNEENNVTIPDLFINEYENRYKDAIKNNGKIIQIETQNCTIDHEKNMIRIIPAEQGKGISSIKINGGLYDGTTYTINYDAKNEDEVDYEIQVIENGLTGYIKGENFNREGTKVEKISKDGYFKKDITDYIIENGENLQIGQENVTIKYEDKEILLPITVYNPDEVKLLKFNDEGLYSFMKRTMFTSECYASEIDNRIIISNEVFETTNFLNLGGDENDFINDFTGIGQLNLKSVRLDGSYCNMESFMNEAVNIPNIEELIIYNFNNSKYISSISNLNNLKKIYINGKNVDDINAILNLSKLEDIEIHCSETIDNIDEVSKKKMLPKFLREIKEKYPESTITARELTFNGETEKQINMDTNGDYYIHLNNQVYTEIEQDESDITPQGYSGETIVTVLISGGIADGSEYILSYMPTGNIEKTKIEIPTAIEGLIYNGEEQKGVAEGEGYTITGNTATDAGEYTATAILNDKENTQWADETTDDKQISWSIAEKIVTIESKEEYEVKNEEMIITNIQPNTKLEDFKEKIIANSEYEVTNSENAIEEQDTLKTGQILRIGDKEYTIIVSGDTDGNGKADIKDILKINKHRLNKNILEGAFSVAGDVNNDDKVNIKDILLINKYRLGKISEI